MFLKGILNMDQHLRSYKFGLERSSNEYRGEFNEYIFKYAAIL